MTIFTGLFHGQGSKTAKMSEQSQPPSASFPTADKLASKAAHLGAGGGTGATTRRQSSSSSVLSPLSASSIPPFPHPLPHKRLAIVASSEGIVIFPASSKRDPRAKAHPAYVGRAALVPYSKAGKVISLNDYDSADDRGRPFCHAYGVLGVLKLFQETYLLVISSKRTIGQYASSDSKTVNGLTGILAIPLSDAAKTCEVLSLQAAEQEAARPRSPVRKTKKSVEPSDISSSSASSSSADESGGSEDSGSETESAADAGSQTHLPAKEEAIAIGRTLAEGGTEAEAIAAGSTPGSREVSSPNLKPTEAPVAAQAGLSHKKAKPSFAVGLGRLFWSTPAEKSSDSPSELISLAGTATPPVSASEPSDASALQKQASAAQSVPIPAIASGAASASALSSPDAASLRELDKKILRQVIAELTSGGYFYSPDFDISRCAQKSWEALQQEKLAARRTGPTNSTAASPTSPGTGGLLRKRGAPHSGAGAIAGQEDGAEETLHDAVIEFDLRKEEPRMMTPLTQRADKRFWYNSWISKPFTDAGLHEYSTVLMQGFAQVQRVSIAAQPLEDIGAQPLSTELEIMVLSRRSVERPGLRYQRRGINDAGGAANFVETEFIISTVNQLDATGRNHVSSYVQTRGSIPLFWSQSPWALKPVPVLERTDEATSAAIAKHFDKQVKTYFGKNVIVNLAEHTGKEGLVVAAYKEHVERLKRDDVKYTEWDFHHICKGMRYEKISLLLDELAGDINELGSFWAMGASNLTTQKGVIRTNCMDCLDRTNVVQSALARNNLTSFLTHLGFGPLDAASQERLEVAFNDIWANNGDAISREYAGTSALKGDFVRSGKRNWRGQFNDATNSIARYWQNTVLDFFKQATIDYLLGINLNAFAEFSEKMQTSDPGEIMHLKAIRQAAIDTATNTALGEGETRLYGWTLLSPTEAGQIEATNYEEKVVLVTQKALYCCSYEYTLQKVRDFVRIPLGQIVSLQKGEYIVSALDPAARNIEENYGLLVRYLPEGSTSRSRTYSIRNKGSIVGAISNVTGISLGEDEASAAPTLLAFKALRKDLVRDLDAPRGGGGGSEISMSSRRQVDLMVEQIRLACEDVGATTEDDPDFVREEAIISLADASYAVGWLDRLNYELKNLIWL